MMFGLGVCLAGATVVEVGFGGVAGRDRSLVGGDERFLLVVQSSEIGSTFGGDGFEPLSFAIEFAQASLQSGRPKKSGRTGLPVTTCRAPAPASGCLLYTSPSPRDKRQSRMPSSA